MGRFHRHDYLSKKSLVAKGQLHILLFEWQRELWKPEAYLVQPLGPVENQQLNYKNLFQAGRKLGKVVQEGKTYRKGKMQSNLCNSIKLRCQLNKQHH